MCRVSRSECQGFFCQEEAGRRGYDLTGVQTCALPIYQSNARVMSVGQTIIQMGAVARINANAVNLGSGAARARTDTGAVNGNYQFGSSQTEQSWKAAKTVEEAQVFGLVPADCQGDNSDSAYRKAMNQNRNGYMAENLVSNANCEINHATMNQSVK